MKLQDISGPTIDEWSLKRSPEWLNGFKDGSLGGLRKSDNPMYIKGWIRGYTKFMEQRGVSNIPPVHRK